MDSTPHVNSGNREDRFWQRPKWFNLGTVGFVIVAYSQIAGCYHTHERHPKDEPNLVSNFYRSVEMWWHDDTKEWSEQLRHDSLELAYIITSVRRVDDATALSRNMMAITSFRQKLSGYPPHAKRKLQTASEDCITYVYERLENQLMFATQRLEGGNSDIDHATSSELLVEFPEMLSHFRECVVPENEFVEAFEKSISIEDRAANEFVVRQLIGHTNVSMLLVGRWATIHEAIFDAMVPMYKPSPVGKGDTP